MNLLKRLPSSTLRWLMSLVVSMGIGAVFELLAKPEVRAAVVTFQEHLLQVLARGNPDFTMWDLAGSLLLGLLWALERLGVNIGHPFVQYGLLVLAHVGLILWQISTVGIAGAMIGNLSAGRPLTYRLVASTNFDNITAALSVPLVIWLTFYSVPAQIQFLAFCVTRLLGHYTSVANLFAFIGYTMGFVYLLLLGAGEKALTDFVDEKIRTPAAKP